MTDVTADTLTPVVQAALGQPDAELLAWTGEPFGHSLDAVYDTARSIYRYSGLARTSDGAIPWSVVLKVVPADGMHEATAFRSGLLAQLSGIRAPGCFGVTDLNGGGAWLWLEDVIDDIGREWPRARYLRAAHHLGQFNAAPPHGVTTMSHPWLASSPLREAVHQTRPGVARIADARDNPHVAQAISPVHAASLLDLLDRIEGWLDRLDRLPQTLCHWDAHRANLLSRTTAGGDSETVVIDWANVGWGPHGAELSKCLSQTVNFFGVDPGDLPALDREMFDHYVEGLRSRGWSGDERAVRFGHAAASAARLIVRTSTALDLAFSARARGAFEQAAGKPFEVLAAGFRATLPYYLSLVDEANALARDGAVP